MVGHPAIWDSARVLNIKALLNKHDKFECQPRDQQELPVPPSELCCPLSARKLMLKPVVLVQTDQCFEKERIKSFVADKGCCPITGEELLQSKLKRHRKMEGRIHAWRCEHGITDAEAGILSGFGPEAMKPAPKLQRASKLLKQGGQRMCRRVSAPFTACYMGAQAAPEAYANVYPTRAAQMGMTACPGAFGIMPVYISSPGFV